MPLPLSAPQMNRSLWKGEFPKSGPLPWPCPFCHAAKPKIIQKTIAEGETRESLLGRDEDAWEPEWIDGRFGFLATCEECKGSISVLGRFRVSDDRYISPSGELVDEWGHHYTPLWFSDAPHIISIPEKTPSDVSDEILASFQVFWGDRFSCANRIRSAVECLLTHERVPKTSKNAQGKRSFLSLHRRIEFFAAKQKALADKLMAIKWVGNAGSHSAGLTADDLLDGYEILGFVLEEMFVRKSEHVERLARTINKRRAPRSKRRGP